MDRCLVTVSSEGIIENAVYFVRNVKADKYMELENASSSNGAPIQIWSLHGLPHGKWTFTLGTDGYYRIKSNSSSKYVRVTGSVSSPGATITQSGTIINGSKWALMRTSSGNIAFVPKSSTSSLVVMNSPGTANGVDLNTATYTANSDKSDEWELTRMLPLSGSELQYGVIDWSTDGNGNYNNCYAYAINNQINPLTNEFWNMQQPGDYYGNRFSAYTKSSIALAVFNDFSKYNVDFSTNCTFTEVGRYTACPSGSYKVALVIGTYTKNGVTKYCYHWYRQDSDGLWSHKPGQTDVTRLDASEKLIIDPQLADRNYNPDGVYDEMPNYTTFCGYYIVTPWNNIYNRPSKSNNNYNSVGLSMISSIE